MTDDDLKITTIPPRRIAKRQIEFAIVPLRLVDCLAKHSKDKAWALLCHLLHENFKSHGEPFKVPNGFLDMIGIGRSAKSRGLRTLERLGVLEVEHRANKSSIVKFKAPWGQRRHQN